MQKQVKDLSEAVDRLCGLVEDLAKYQLAAAEKNESKWKYAFFSFLFGFFGILFLGAFLDLIY